MDERDRAERPANSLGVVAAKAVSGVHWRATFKVHAGLYLERMLEPLRNAKALGGSAELEKELAKMKNELSAGGLQ